MNRYLKLAAILPLTLLGGVSAYASSLPAVSSSAPVVSAQAKTATHLLPANPGDDEHHDHEHANESGHSHEESESGEAGHTHGKSADPALQQVVKDDEQIDLETAVVVESGHLDMGPKLINGKWQFVVRDDSVQPATWRDLDKIVVKMKDSAQEKIPESGDFSFTGLKAGETAWVIPQTEKTSVPWLGWSTQSPSVVNEVNGQVKVTMEGHQGDGELSVFIQDGNFGAPQQLWNSQSKEAQTINLDVNTHTHMNWVFTKPGIHLVRFTLSAELKDGSKVTDTKTLHFAIGDNTDPQQALNAKWKSSATPKSATAEASSVSSNDGDSSTVIIYTGIGLLVLAGAGIAYALVVIRKNRSQKSAALLSNLEEEQDKE